MTYDYLTINYAAAAGMIFLLIFLHANASLDRKIKEIFHVLIFVEFIEIVTYSLELWTTTFSHLSQWRLWLSAIGYTVRPVILFLILLLTTRNSESEKCHKIYYVPMLLNTVAAFSVFFTDIVYSYTPDNLFVRGPLGYFTHIVALVYLIFLIAAVIKNHSGRPKLETLIIFAISFLIVFYMVVEAVYGIRTLGQTSIVMITIFYYMYFQTQVYKNSLSAAQSIHSELEYASRVDGLTHVLNKKAFADAAVNILQAYSSIPHSGIAFLFVDLDYLKSVNDTLGHSMGDTAIVEAANTLKHTFRKNDLIGRFGGDEFCILLTNIPRDPLAVLIASIQSDLRREYSANGRKASVSASIGVVHTSRLIHLSYEEMIKLADEALYEAKASGRDCHVINEI